MKKRKETSGDFILKLTASERKSIKLEAIKQDKTMQEILQECIRTSKSLNLNK